MNKLNKITITGSILGTIAIVLLLIYSYKEGGDKLITKNNLDISLLIKMASLFEEHEEATIKFKQTIRGKIKGEGTEDKVIKVIEEYESTVRSRKEYFQELARGKPENNEYYISILEKLKKLLNTKSDDPTVMGLKIQLHGLARKLMEDMKKLGVEHEKK